MQDYTHFVEWAFFGLVGGSAVYGVSILAHLKLSIDTLNERVATIIEKTAWHERELRRQDERIQKLESGEK